MPCGPPDGEIVTIKAEHKLDLPDQDILMLQFLLITGWAMAAGREPKHFNFDFDYDTDRFWEARRKSAKSYFETLEDKTSTMEDIYELLQSCLKEVNRNDAVFHASLWCVLYQTDSDQLGGVCDELRELWRCKDIKEISLYMGYFEKASIAFERSLHIFHKAHDLYESLNGDGKKKRCDPNAVRDALNRDDGKCVLLGTADPMACHIAPFAIKTFLSELTRIPDLFPADLLHRVHNKTTINMQAKWDGRGQNLRDLLPPRLGRYDHWSVKTGRLIQDGEVIAIKAKNRLDLPDRDFLEIQHRLISAWSMAAGVEPKNFTFEDEGPDQPRG
ncbi:hypothetical protein K4K59_000243 [Colletotrichum sp. SAR11_240]|nr:hypothetical protein K4K59_000243 [Colletotrichum sp. SAR11_240]